MLGFYWRRTTWGLHWHRYKYFQTCIWINKETPYKSIRLMKNSCAISTGCDNLKMWYIGHQTNPYLGTSTTHTLRSYITTSLNELMASRWNFKDCTWIMGVAIWELYYAMIQMENSGIWWQVMINRNIIYQSIKMKG